MTSKVVKFNVHEHVDELPPVYIGRCCREWPLAMGFKGRCGLCGEIPVFVKWEGE